MVNTVDVNITRDHTNETLSWIVSFQGHIGDLPEMKSEDETFVSVTTVTQGTSIEQHLKGGVCACSSKDLVHWRNEGVMIHYSNISDPFGMFPSVLNHPLRAQRPKVLPNHDTNRFVMWMQIDTRGNENETLAAAAVATSFYPNGPFILTRSSFPDHDHTHDCVRVRVGRKKKKMLLTMYFPITAQNDSCHDSATLSDVAHEVDDSTRRETFRTDRRCYCNVSSHLRFSNARDLSRNMHTHLP